MSVAHESLLSDLEIKLAKLKGVEEFEIFMQQIKIHQLNSGFIDDQMQRITEGIAVRIITKDRRIGFFSTSISQFSYLIPTIRDNLKSLSLEEHRTFIDLKKNRISVPKLSKQEFSRLIDYFESVSPNEPIQINAIFVEDSKIIANSSSPDIYPWENKRSVQCTVNYLSPNHPIKMKTQISNIKSVKEVELEISSFEKRKREVASGSSIMLREPIQIILSPRVVGKLLLEIMEVQEFSRIFLNSVIDQDLSIYENPLHPFSYSSASIDDEGLRTSAKWLFGKYQTLEVNSSIDPRFVQLGGVGFRIGENSVWPHHYSLLPQKRFTNLLLDGGWLRKDYLFTESNYIFVEDAEINLNFRFGSPIVIFQIKQGEYVDFGKESSVVYGGSFIVDLQTIFTGPNLTKEVVGNLHHENLVSTYTGYASISKEDVKILT